LDPYTTTTTASRHDYLNAHLNNDDFLIRMLLLISLQRFVLETCIRSNRSPLFDFFSFNTCILYELCLTTSK